MGNSIKTREFYLYQELRNADLLIKEGLSELCTISYANDFYVPLFLYLSNGLEKLMKCLLCCLVLDTDKNTKEETYYKTHDLRLIRDRIIAYCDSIDYGSKFGTRVYIDFIKTDKDLNEILRILSDFGKGGRYYYLDYCFKGTSESEDPIASWQKLELKVSAEKAPSLSVVDDKGNLFYEITNENIKNVIERFERAIVSLFKSGGFGEVAKRAGNKVW
jgi:hypothetical protein